MNLFTVAGICFGPMGMALGIQADRAVTTLRELPSCAADNLLAAPYMAKVAIDAFRSGRTYDDAFTRHFRTRKVQRLFDEFDRDIAALEVRSGKS